VKNEIEVLRKLSHPNIIKLFEVFEGEEHIYFVLEYVKGSDLRHYVRKKSISEKDRVEILKALFESISFIETKQILHRDLKLENILILYD